MKQYTPATEGQTPILALEAAWTDRLDRQTPGVAIPEHCEGVPLKSVVSSPCIISGSQG